jgi:hypothetical protein
VPAAPLNLAPISQKDAITALSAGMGGYNKVNVIESVSLVAPANYGIFIKAVNALSAGMAGYNKVKVIESVNRLAPANYGRFIRTVNALSVGMDGHDKIYIIKVAIFIPAALLPVLQQYIVARPNYFRVVSAVQFGDAIVLAILRQANLTVDALRQGNITEDDLIKTI